jgi:hypothetical protein
MPEPTDSQKLVAQAGAFDKQIERLQDRCVIMKECGPAMRPEQLANMIYDTVDCMSNAVIVLRNMFTLTQQARERSDNQLLALFKRFLKTEQMTAEMYAEMESEPDDIEDANWWKNAGDSPASG